MQGPILVPLDGSPFSASALPFAREIARRTASRLHLIHVHVPLISAYVDGIPIVDQALDAASRANDLAYLEAVQRAQAEAGDLPIATTLLDGPVAPTIADHAASIHAPLIVMTTHGRGGLARLWLGSVADELIRRASQPLLLLRPHESAALVEPPVSCRRILVPLDGSALAEQILGPALALGQALEAEYLLVEVVDALVLGSTPLMPRPPRREYESLQQRQDEAERYLSTVAQRVEAAGHRVQTQVLVDPQPAHALLSAAHEHDIELIAMATHGRGGLTRLLLGSVADKILRGAEIPVLLQRPQ